MGGMARTATTHDPFNAVAEPKRRKVLDAIGSDEVSVNELVARLGWSQPTTSKHLGVLKKVGLVRERRAGRQRFYRVNAAQLKPIHDWTQSFQEMWEARFERLNEYLQELQRKEKLDEQ
jgi:DNA-binding transcriptional ArsR family regulator